LTGRDRKLLEFAGLFRGTIDGSLVHAREAKKGSEDSTSEMVRGTQGGRPRTGVGWILLDDIAVNDAAFCIDGDA
jgi:hypothetical protein